VFGRVPALLAASLGVGIVVAACAAGQGMAQTSNFPAGMRTTIDGESDGARARRTKQSKPAKPTDSSPVGQVPTFGVPPASGAGKTGYVSVAPKRRPKGTAGSPAQSGQAQNQPLALTPSGIVVTPDQVASGGGDTPPSKPTKKPKVAPKAAAPKPVTAPKAPALIARDQAKEQLNTLPNTVVPLRRRVVVVEEDPYDPVGIRAGSFILRPAIETFGGYDSNPGRVHDGRGSAFIGVAPELSVRSDWERHGFAADVRGSQTWYNSTPELDRPTLDAKVAGRIDVTERTRSEIEGHFVLGTDNPGSPNLQAGLAKLPIFTTIGGSAALIQRFNRLELAARGTIDHTEYQDSHFTDGTTFSNAGRNYDQYGGQFRASYELSPGLKPFAEVDIDTRAYQLPIDAGGFMRDSDGIAGKAGAAFEIPRTLIGEFAIGYLERTYKDPALQDLRGFLVDGSLAWNATALTTVKATAKTTANESTLFGVSGVLSRDFGVEVDHAFRRWLIGAVKLGYGFDDYVGSVREDKRYFASAGMIYKLTRTWQVKGEFRQEWRNSNLPGNNYIASVATVGLRWQP